MPGTAQIIEERHHPPSISSPLIKGLPVVRPSQKKIRVANALTGKYQQTSECRESATVRVSPCLNGIYGVVCHHDQYPYKNSSSIHSVNIIASKIVTTMMPEAYVKDNKNMFADI